ncbi:MAG: hypothetical protein LBS48_06915 [Treponema sp.]|jgi:hypothetical protein|nr:hypothetical protein [Treponema sp.]
MKMRYTGFFLLGLLILAGAVSCKSTKAVTEEPPRVEETLDPENGPPDRAALNSLNDAAGRAANARQLVMDFNGPTYFPQDWSSADSLYTQAESRKSTSTQREARDSANRYDAAAGAFNALADKTLPRYAQDLEGEVTGARTAAVSAGAAYYAQDYLQEADTIAAQALDQYDGKDYYAARDTAFVARDMYQTLETGVEALKVRLIIEDGGLARYDPTAIEAADKLGLSAIDDYHSGNIAGARGKASDVLSQYTQSLLKGKESYASDSGAAAATERQRALDAKANVAVRQDYDAANAVYNKAVTFFRGKNYDDAAVFYNESRSLFENTARTAREKRSMAEEALRAAELKMTESGEYAEKAEIQLEGGAQ